VIVITRAYIRPRAVIAATDLVDSGGDLVDSGGDLVDSGVLDFTGIWVAIQP
jgi:hypothetical protein